MSAIAAPLCLVALGVVALGAAAGASSGRRGSLTGAGVFALGTLAALTWTEAGAVLPPVLFSGIAILVLAILSFALRFPRFTDRSVDAGREEVIR